MGRGQKRWKSLAKTRRLDCLYHSPWNGLVLVRNSVSPQEPALIRSKDLCRSCKTSRLNPVQSRVISVCFSLISGEIWITVLPGSFDGALAAPSPQGSKAGIPVASTEAVQPSPGLKTQTYLTTEYRHKGSTQGSLPHTAYQDA